MLRISTVIKSILLVTILVSSSLIAAPRRSSTSTRSATQAATAAPRACASALVALSDPANTKLLSWRAKRSYPVAGKGFVKTTASREKEIRDSNKDSADTVLGGATPPLDIFAAPGVTLNDLDRKPQDSYGVSPWDLEVTGLKKTKGILYATLELPVSGHTGAADAKRWATSDKILVELIDSRGNRTVLVNHVQSKDIVTNVDVEIPLKKGEEVRLEYSRPPGNGVGGFANGRTIYLTWDGN